MKAARSSFTEKYIFNHEKNGRKLMEALLQNNFKYNKDGTFTVYTYHSSEKVTRLYIRVEFASQKVVEILPMYFP